MESSTERSRSFATRKGANRRLVARALEAISRTEPQRFSRHEARAVMLVVIATRNLPASPISGSAKSVGLSAFGLHRSPLPAPRSPLPGLPNDFALPMLVIGNNVLEP